MLGQTLECLAVLFTALMLVPAAAHVLELPNKIRLSREEYLTVQQIYRGWALAGIVVIAALVATAALMAVSAQAAFVAAPLAFLCVAATQVVFWVWTFPVNRATDNWTLAPSNWLELRRRWEYSHATSAVFGLIAFVSTIVAVVSHSPA